MLYNNYSITWCEQLESLLRNLKIRFNQKFIDEHMANYELFVGSMSSFINIEFGTVSDESVYFQFYTMTGGNENSFYHNGISSDDEEFSLEYESEQLIEKTKMINTAINKIENKIEQIKEICSEYDLDYKDFIEVVFNFE